MNRSAPSSGLDLDAVAGGVLALEQAERHRVDEVLGDDALERARAVGRVVAHVAEQVAGGVRELDVHAALGHAHDQAGDLEVDDLAQLLA